MTDLKKARELEALRYHQALKALDSQEQSRIGRLNAEMVNRGLQRSDARLKALFDERLNKVSLAVDRRIEIRQDLVRSCPELGSNLELKRLMDTILEDVTRLREEAQKGGLLIAPEVFSALQDRGRAGIDGIRREMTVNLPPKSKQAPVAVSSRSPVTVPASSRVAAQVSLNARTVPPSLGSTRSTATVAVSSRSTATIPASTRNAAPVSAASRGSATVSGNVRVAPASPASARGSATVTAAAGNPQTTAALDAVYAKTEQAIKDAGERNAKLADALRQLAAAIKAANRTADERAEYLEQVQFIAEQSVRPEVIRRVNVVKGLLFALRGGLQNAANVASILNTAGPVMASHFGLRWPSR
ncbi:MAG: hypothetical protein LAP40_03990 [Acidobacteriia bacterium]|nr:hypothetical protein [Terriglobia bacterium]